VTTAPLIGALEAHARATPDLAAVVDGAARIPYAALARDSRRLAALLARAGIAPGDAVGLTIAAEVPNLLACLALLRLGCRQVALPRRDPPAMRAALAARLRVVAVIGEAAADALPDAPLLRIDAARIARDAALDAAPLPAAQGGGIVFGTSGTTGRPKLMLVTQAMLVAQSAALRGHGRVFHRVLSHDTNHARRLQLRSLALGGTEVLAAPMEGGLAALCRAHGIERVHLSPGRAEALLDEAGGRVAAAWPAGTRVFTTGGRLPQALRRRLARDLAGPVHVHYGATETGTVSLTEPGEHEAEPETVGRAVPGVTLAVVDDAGAPLPAGEPGLLRIRAPGAIAGYIDDAEATAHCFVDGWFQPGDVGRLTPEGRIVIAGRADDRMVLGGIKIFPAEIEAVVEDFATVAACAAFAQHSPSLGDIPMVAVVPREGFDAAALLAHCRARLGVRAPRRIVALDALPRNAAGKILRRELLQRSGAARG
jgi:acyl-coenzyme A synthetase/AMP-(fatty) acid ligase